MNEAMKQRWKKVKIYEQIYQLVQLIPAGRVSTYGKIAQILGCTARQVGYAMAIATSQKNIPWHRVVNSQGLISNRSNGFPDPRQRVLLEQEGIDFSEKGCIDLTQFECQEIT